MPNLLVNGAEGIAVGMSTSIPTHNLGEVIDAVKAYIDNRLLTVEELMQYMPGPDFPQAVSLPIRAIFYRSTRLVLERSSSAERSR